MLWRFPPGQKAKVEAGRGGRRLPNSEQAATRLAKSTLHRGQSGQAEQTQGIKGQNSSSGAFSAEAQPPPRAPPQLRPPPETGKATLKATQEGA